MAMSDVLVSVMLVLGGVLVIALRSPLARLQIASQNRFWGLKFGERSVAISKVVFIIMGVGLIVAGPLNLIAILTS